MILTQEELLDRVAERTVENTELLKRSLRQRRNQVVDIYGMEFTRQGAKDAPATFYISISPDMVYLERFEFKLIIQPFLSPVGAESGAAQVIVDDASIIPYDYAEFVGDELHLNYNTVTDPHTHTTQPHKHSMSSSMGQIHTTATDFLISIEGIDVTPYLMAQYGSWIAGEGIYPSLVIGEKYDILEVASDFCAEGKYDEASLLTKPGYKKVEIFSDSPFQVSLVLYCKYSHCNR